MKGIIVLGPAGSGTRIVTRIIVENGAYGQYTHTQELDKYIGSPAGCEIIEDNNNSHYVIRRSIPHGRTLPDLSKIIDLFLINGISDMVFVVTHRYREYSAMSQLNGHNGLIKNKKEGMKNIEKAMDMINDELSLFAYEFLPVNYEMLVAYPWLMQRYICRKLGLEFKNEIDIINGNKKYEKN